MSYSTCRQCYDTVHESDVVQGLTGSPTRDCSMLHCSYTAPLPVVKDDAEVWKEYSIVIRGSKEYHRDMSLCMVRGKYTISECMAQADRKRDGNDDI